MTGAGSNLQEFQEQFLKSLNKADAGAAACRLFGASIGHSPAA
jgi:hypothetical protein